MMNYKRAILILGILTVLSLALVTFHGRGNQSIMASDGTEIRFLGMTRGTDHWNPKIPEIQRRLYGFQMKRKVGWLVSPFLPKNPANLPMVVSSANTMDLLWFDLCGKPTGSRYFVVRLVDDSNNEFGLPLNLVSSTNVFPFNRGVPISRSMSIWTPVIVGEDTNSKPLKAIRIYERDLPLPTVRASEGPVPEFLMDLYLQNLVGTFGLDE
jgi:hypothetical protein